RLPRATPHDLRPQPGIERVRAAAHPRQEIGRTANLRGLLDGIRDQQMARGTLRGGAQRHARPSSEFPGPVDLAWRAGRIEPALQEHQVEPAIELAADFLEQRNLLET